MDLDLNGFSADHLDLGSWLCHDAPMNSRQVDELDRELVAAAKYDSSHGGMVAIRQEEVVQRFREFKHLVLRGEATIDEVKDMVYSRWGDPVKDDGPRDPTPEEISRMPRQEVC